MISIRFEEKQQIGLQYALETLHGCSPFGQEKIRRLRFYTPAERGELERNCTMSGRLPSTQSSSRACMTKFASCCVR